MLCKLLTPDLKTFGDTQWRFGEWKFASGRGPLCSDGWLHAYEDPLLAVFLNPIHANIPEPRLCEVAVRGNMLDAHGTMFGATDMCLVQELPPLRAINDQRRIKFALLCVLRATESERFAMWAEEWLLGKNRTYDDARRVADELEEETLWVGDLEMPLGMVPAEVWAARAASVSYPLDVRCFAAAAVAKAATEFGVATKRSLNLVKLAKEAVS